MTLHRLRMHGRPDVLDFVRKRQDQWQWWQGAAGETAVAAFDDMVTIAALRPAELFESGAPASGVSLRLRPRWRNTKQGLPKTPAAEVVSLILDGRKLPIEPVQQGGERGALRDFYYIAHLEALPPGRHAAQVELKHIGSGKLTTHACEFVLLPA